MKILIMFSKPLNVIVLFVCLRIEVWCEMEGFIVGGQAASIKKFPHSAFLDIYCNTTSPFSAAWVCGSSIINQYFLLTAAHCVAGCTRHSQINVLVGNTNREKGLSVQGYKYKAHTYFNEITLNFDIALVMLRKALPFRAEIKRIIITTNVPDTETAYVAGWGLVDVSYIFFIISILLLFVWEEISTWS